MGRFMGWVRGVVGSPQKVEPMHVCTSDEEDGESPAPQDALFAPLSSSDEETTPIDMSSSGADERVLRSGVVVSSTLAAPKKRGRKRKRSHRAPPAEEEKPKRALTVSQSAEKRIKVCVLVVEGGLSQRASCKLVGVSRHSAVKGRWVEKYERGGISALLVDERGGQTTKMTPRTEAVVQSCAQRGD